MNNLEKYKRCFHDVLSLEQGFDVNDVKMNATPDWDSVGHIDLITTIEDAFDIMFETEDILKFTSYTIGIEILKKYGIEIV